MAARIFYQVQSLLFGSVVTNLQKVKGFFFLWSITYLDGEQTEWNNVQNGTNSEKNIRTYL